MWTPATMKQILMVTLDSDVPAVTEEMGRYGALHLLAVSELGDWASGLEWKEAGEFSAMYESYGRRMQTLLQVLSIDISITPPEGVQIAPRNMAMRIGQRLAEIEADVRQWLKRQQKLQEESGRLGDLADQLQLLAPLAIDLSDLRNLSFLYFTSALVPEERLDRLRGSLARTPNVIVPIAHRDGRVLIFAFSTREKADVLERALKSAYAQHRDIPEEIVGTPMQALHQVQAQQKVLAKQNEELQKTKEVLASKYSDELSRMHWQLAVNATAVDAWRHFGKTQQTSLISGWLPAKIELDFVSSLSRAVGGRIVVYSDEAFQHSNASYSGDPTAPTFLDNPAVIKPFEVLVNTYGIPNYREIDPTPIVALLFLIMFGMMFGDVGQGLVLAIGGLLLARNLLIKGNTAFGWVLFGCGLSATAFGFLYGTVFLSEQLIPPLWLRPLSNPQSLLTVTIAFGVVIVSMGLIVNVIDAIRMRNRPRLFIDQYGLVGIWFYWGTLLVALEYLMEGSVSSFLIVALVGVPLILLYLHEPLLRFLKGERGGRAWLNPLQLSQSMIEVLDTALRYLSNTISFVRLAAFAISHASIGLMVITIVAIVRELPLGEPVVFVIGNLFVMTLEGLVVFIQSLRLVYYEFFTKFFEGDGVAYRPFVIPDAWIWHKK